MIEFEKVEKYELIRVSTEEDYKYRRVLFPATQKEFSLIDSIYDVSVINSRISYMGAPTDYGRDITPYVMIRIKPEFLSTVLAG